MRSLLAILAAAGGLAFVAADAHACSARGTHCGYPEWAANAFEGPRGSHAKGQINIKHLHHHQAYGYAHRPTYEYGYGSAHHVKRHHVHKHKNH